MTTTWVSFKQIKTEVAIEHVLTRYGVQLRRVVGELRGRCPLPTHTAPRSRDSFSVNTSRNVWSCRSLSCMQARGGKPGGNLLDLVAIMERCSVRDAALRLQHWSGARPPRVPVETVATPVANPPLSFTLRHIDQQHPYLVTRGLAPETVRTFGVGFYDGKGFLRGRIVIPIRDAEGELVAYAGRALDGQEPKYRFPTGFRKSLVLFNLHRVLTRQTRTVIVVEGFFDAMAVHQAGYTAVVALMGSTLSRAQADVLTTHFDRVLLMLDGDEAGRHGMTAIAAALRDRLEIRPILLDDGAQPDHLAASVIQRLVRGERRA